MNLQEALEKRDRLEEEYNKANMHGNLQECLNIKTLLDHVQRWINEYYEDIDEPIDLQKG